MAGAGTKRKTGPKTWSVTEREGVKARIQQLDLHGYNQTQIAAKLAVEGVTVDRATVGRMLGEIQKEYLESYVDNRKAYVMRATAAHLDLIMQAQEAIAKLRQFGHNKRVTRTFEKNVKDDEGNWTSEPVTEVTESVEDGQISPYLSIITENWKQIALLHGLHELPKQVFNIQVNNNTVNVFEQVLKAVLGAQDDDAASVGSVAAADGVADGGSTVVVVPPAVDSDSGPPRELLDANGANQQG